MADFSDVLYSFFAVHDGSGKLVVLEAIFGGKTARSLPPLKQRAKFTNINADVSESHWATEATKIRLAQEIKVRKTRELIDGGMSPEQAAAATLVWWFDCWSVNIKASFQETVNSRFGLKLMVHPAGATSWAQINDTDLNKPFHDAHRRQAQRWFQSKLALITDKYWDAHDAAEEAKKTAMDDDTIDAAVKALTEAKQEYDMKLSKMMSYPCLRAKQLPWLQAALDESVLKKDEGQRHLARVLLLLIGCLNFISCCYCCRRQEQH